MYLVTETIHYGNHQGSVEARGETVTEAVVNLTRTGRTYLTSRGPGRDWIIERFEGGDTRVGYGWGYYAIETLDA